MPDHESPAGAVLVGVTDTPEARAAAAYAAQLATDTDTDTTVQVAHVYWVPTNFLDVAGKSMIGELETAARTLVDGVAADLRQSHPAPVTTTTVAGKPVPVLTELASTASILVLGQDTATLVDRMTFGAVAGHLAAAAPVPVVIVPATWDQASLGQHPVVALTDDHPAPATLTTAIAQARRLGTSVLVLHTVHENTPADQIEQHQHDLAAAVAATARRGRTDVAVESRVVEGDPRDHVVAESVNAAAVVVGPAAPSRHHWLAAVGRPCRDQAHPLPLGRRSCRVTIKESGAAGTRDPRLGRRHRGSAP